MKKINLGLMIISNSWGGAEMGVFNLAKYLNKSVFKVHLLINNSLVNYYQELDDVVLINLGEWESNKKLAKISSIFSCRNKLNQAIKKYQIKLLNINLENSMYVWGLFPAKIHIPVVLILRGEETRLYHHPKSVEHRVIRYLLNRALDNSNTKVVALSNWLIKDFPKSVKTQIKVIPTGIDVNLYKSIKSKKIKNSVLHWGRLVPGKGIEHLLSVAKSEPDIKFLFGGKGPLSELINLPNTKHLGFIPKEELSKVCAKAEICAFPSYAEGLATVGLEAMSCGLPMISTSPGFSDYVENGKNGLLVEKGSEDQLRHAIKRLLDDNILRTRLAKNAKSTVLKYDIKKCVLDYEELFHSMAVM